MGLCGYISLKKAAVYVVLWSMRLKRRYLVVRKSDRPLLDDRGVTMLEFALILPLFMMLTLGMIDLARVYTLKAILNKGAEEGLNIALKIPNLDVDIENLSPTHYEYGRYIQARNIVIDRATRLPLATLFSDDDPQAMARLANFVYSDPNSVTNVDDIRNGSAAFLRPGDRLQKDSQTSGEWVNHRTLPNDGTGNPRQQTPEILYKSHPIIVELRANIRPLTPFIPELNIASRSMGYREEVPKGPLDVAFGLLDPLEDPNFDDGTDGVTPPGILPDSGDRIENPIDLNSCSGPVRVNNCPNLLATFPRCLGCNAASNSGFHLFSF